MSTALPDGYTPLEYIESGDGQYIIPNTSADGRVILDVEPLGEGCFYGTYQYAYRNASQKTYITNAIYSNTENIYAAAWLGSATVVSESKIGKRISCEIDFYTGEVLADGTQKTISINTAARDINSYSLSPAYLLARASGSSANNSVSATNALHARVYGCKIYNYRGTLLRDYIPCKNIAGVAGLYDTIYGNFHVSANGTPFRSGPSIAPERVSVTALASPEGGGSVAGGGSYEPGASVTVSATPAAGWKFLRWEEDGRTVSTSGSYTFDAETARTLTAVFRKLLYYTVSLSAEPETAGTVSGGGEFAEDSRVVVTASARNGYVFAGWSEDGAAVSGSTAYAFILTSDRMLTARFEESQSPIQPEESGASASGFARRELYVDARDLQSDSDPDKPLTQDEYLAILQTRGLEKLAENQLVRNFSAAVRTVSPTYVYGVDFFPGDTITAEDDQLGVAADAVVQGATFSVGENGVGMDLILGYDTPTLSEILKRKAGK